MASQDGEERGQPLRFVDDRPVLLRQGEERIGREASLVSRILQVEERVIGERQTSERRLADLPCAEDDRGRRALADGAQASGGDPRLRHVLPG
jgi:hypothetical protein